MTLRDAKRGQARAERPHKPCSSVQRSPGPARLVASRSRRLSDVATPEGHAVTVWSSSARAQRTKAIVTAYEPYEVTSVPWQVFRDRWLPDLAREGLRVGVTWSGEKAVGYALDVHEVRERVVAAMSSAQLGRRSPYAHSRTPSDGTRRHQGRLACAMKDDTPTLTPRMKRTIWRAEQLARARGHSHLGTEHLILALIEDPDGIAGGVMQRVGCAAAIRDEVIRIIESDGYSRGSPTATDAPLVE